jgi:putative ABC transport system permease protein
MYQINLSDLGVGFIPVLITLGLMLYWSLSIRTALVSIGRMLLQLLVIGYALNFIFGSDSSLIVTLVLCAMLFAASWISLNPVENRSARMYGHSLIAISIGGLLTLAVTSQGVLHLDPWYDPSVIIPIAGMIFSSSMTTVSLAAERFFSEQRYQTDYRLCRNIAYQAAMIPIFNSLLAVGLVSLPGMMTGQILSGVEPLIAVRYQIMVMLMVFGASGISAAIFLQLLKPEDSTT